MGDILDKGNLAWRDHAVAGNPGSGAHEPLKSEIRAFVAEVETQVSAYQQSAGAGFLTFETVPDMEAYTPDTVGVTASVIDVQQIYRWDGAAWVLIGPDPNARLDALEAADVAMDSRVDAVQADIAALPTITAFPSVGGKRPVVMRADGSPLVSTTLAGLLIEHEADPALVMEPSVRGHRVLERDPFGRVVRSKYLGQNVDRSISSPPKAALVDWNGADNIQVTTVDPYTLASQGTFRLTSNQTSDGITLGPVMGANSCTIYGTNPLLPVHTAYWRPKTPLGRRLGILSVSGQSGSVGATSSLGSSAPPVVISEIIPPYPDLVYCFNGGPIPHQLSGGATAADEIITADRYASVVDCAESIGASVRNSIATAAAMAIAGPQGFNGGLAILVVNWGSGSNDFGDIVGTSSAEAIPLQGFKLMLGSATLASFCAANNFDPFIVAHLHDGHQGDDGLSVVNVKAQHAVMRTRIQECNAILGKTATVPIVWTAIAKPTAAGRMSNTAIALMDSALTVDASLIPVPEYSLPMPPYDFGAGAVPYASVHFPSASHVYKGMRMGIHAARWYFENRDRGWLYMTKLERISGHTVARATLSGMIPAVVDTANATATDDYGFRCFNPDNSEVAISGVAVGGNHIWFTFATAPVDGARILVPDKGAQDFGSGDYGLGNGNGMRCNVRSMDPIGWHEMTGEPIFSWLAMQQITETIVTRYTD